MNCRRDPQRRRWMQSWSHPRAEEFDNTTLQRTSLITCKLFGGCVGRKWQPSCGVVNAAGLDISLTFSVFDCASNFVIKVQTLLQVECFTTKNVGCRSLTPAAAKHNQIALRKPTVHRARHRNPNTDKIVGKSFLLCRCCMYQPVADYMYAVPSNTESNTHSRS